MEYDIKVLTQIINAIFPWCFGVSCNFSEIKDFIRKRTNLSKNGEYA